MEDINGTSSWSLTSDLVRLWVSCDGAHVAPVEFRLEERVVSPYALAPWLPEEVDPELPALLKVLRGDFFCLPFGPQDGGPPHGDPANATWTKQPAEPGSLNLSLKTSDSGARIEQAISLRDGESCIYRETRISELTGEWSYGNHPILDLSGLEPGSGRLSVSPFRYAAVYDQQFSDPANREYQALEIGAQFDDLAKVPLAAGGTTDLTRYPARPGCDDLVMMVNEPASEAQPFAWTAVVLDGYLWFSLKDPADFPATLFWISNGGRHGEPWNGRHVGRIGLEEVCSHFCGSVDDSRRSPLAALGIQTVRDFSANTCVRLATIQGIAATPVDFGRVVSIRPAGSAAVIIEDEHGTCINASVDWSFVKSQ